MRRTRTASTRAGLLICACALLACPGGPPDPPVDAPDRGEPLSLELPRRGIVPDELGVVVNTDDPLSAAIAAAYMAARGIPSANRVDLALGTAANLDRATFQAAWESMDAAFGDGIQALAITSMTPQTVDCMGASAAFALGFDTVWCQPGPPCNPTGRADTYDSDTTTPHTDYGIRPAMILAATTLVDAEALITRGVASDGTMPRGRGVMVRTSDAARSTRWEGFQATLQSWGELLDLTYIDNSDGAGDDSLSGEDGLILYFTGLTFVDALATNAFLPGAVADHLTSFGGQLPTSSQMSAIEWLRAGATASYGTAIEPCNYTTKFPEPEVLIPHYVGGNTVVEAYWKSVWMPGEGNFVGEPLARPWAGAETTYVEGVWTITTTNLVPDQRYALEAWIDGGWEHVQRIEFDRLGFQTIEVVDAVVTDYRLIED